MTGTADPFDFFSAAHTPRQGRHRHARDADSRTPSALPARRGPRDAAVEGSLTGSLPLPAPEPPAPAEVTAPITPVISSVLTPEDEQSRPQAAPAGEDSEEPTLRRHRITLTSDPEPVREERDEARVYVAPPPDGLGKFDLGSVPASVTPPSTWRKAAWFASLSSDGVVVALLVAGTALVTPDDDRRAIEGWPDRNGAVAPLLPDEQYDDGNQEDLPGSASTSTPDDAPSSESPSPDDTGEPASFRSPGSPERGSSSSDAPSGTTGPSTTVPTTTTPTLTKPPSTPAPTSTARQKYFTVPYDAEEMAKQSQAFLDTVTEDPQAAHELTTGELAAQGPKGLEQKYADIAYFEVKHIYVDQNEGYTVNTVEVTYTDGSTTEETRRLTFESDEKISSDGQ